MTRLGPLWHQKELVLTYLTTATRLRTHRARTTTAEKQANTDLFFSDRFQKIYCKLSHKGSTGGLL